jgi:hypothetical protein
MFNEPLTLENRWSPRVSSTSTLFFKKRKNRFESYRGSLLPCNCSTISLSKSRSYCDHIAVYVVSLIAHRSWLAHVSSGRVTE